MSIQFKKEAEASSTTTDSMSYESFNDIMKYKDLKDLIVPDETTTGLKQLISFKKQYQIPYDFYDKDEYEYLPIDERIARYVYMNKNMMVDYDQENLPNLINIKDQQGYSRYQPQQQLIKFQQQIQQIPQLQIQSQQQQQQQKKRSSKTLGDRFIPSRKSSKFIQYSRFNHYENADISSQSTAMDLLYKRQILQQSNYMEEENENKETQFSNHNTLRYNEPLYYQDQMHPNNKESPLVSDKYFTVPEDIGLAYSRYMRKIPKVPFKVLDAPQLQDDFYLNLIDWGSQNILSVALGSCVYLWSAQSSKVTKLLDLGQADQVTSVAWALQGQILSVGTNSGDVQIWDTVKLKRVRLMKGHQSRVGTLCFSQSLLSSGSRDKQILQRDLRAQDQFQWKLNAHRQEVCGLKWSPDSQYLASGGNDNKLFLWSAQQNNTPVCKFSEHQAAVKAIAWSPHQHCLLASGGGTADRTIRFWNALEGKHIMKEDTGSQVCNLMFSKRENEIISTHGYSQNQIVLWKSREMKRVVTLTGHTLRVLYLAMSPDGQTIVTGAGDETLRFWNIYPSNTSNDEIPIEGKNLSLSGNSLR